MEALGLETGVFGVLILQKKMKENINDDSNNKLLQITRKVFNWALRTSEAGGFLAETGVFGVAIYGQTKLKDFSLIWLRQEAQDVSRDVLWRRVACRASRRCRRPPRPPPRSRGPCRLDPSETCWKTIRFPSYSDFFFIEPFNRSNMASSHQPTSQAKMSCCWSIFYGKLGKTRSGRLKVLGEPTIRDTFGRESVVKKKRWTTWLKGGGTCARASACAGRGTVRPSPWWRSCRDPWPRGIWACWRRPRPGACTGRSTRVCTWRPWPAAGRAAGRATGSGSRSARPPRPPAAARTAASSSSWLSSPLAPPPPWKKKTTTNRPTSKGEPQTRLSRHSVSKKKILYSLRRVEFPLRRGNDAVAFVFGAARRRRRSLQAEGGEKGSPMKLGKNSVTSIEPSNGLRTRCGVCWVRFGVAAAAASFLSLPPTVEGPWTTAREKLGR